jgi:hypothetical protein
LPQVVMIEGESAGAALGRAIRLGARNWYRVGAIALFSYFVTASFLAALTLPMLAAAGFSGSLNQQVVTDPLWNAVYSAFNQISSLLVLPIWIVSLTLLYFDSRVRKEGYDVELLARGIQPEGLLDRSDRQRAAGPVATAPIGAPMAVAYTVPAAGSGAVAIGDPILGAAAAIQCLRCGTALEPGARFCHVCGQGTASS